MVAIQFKLRSDGTVVYTHRAFSLKTHFDSVFGSLRRSPGFKRLHAGNVVFEYFVGSSSRSISTKSTKSLKELGISDKVPVEIVEHRECTIHFKRRSDGQIIHSYKAKSLQTQFICFIQGFWECEYFKNLRANDVLFEYFAGSSTRSISTKSTQTLEKLGISDQVPVEIVENHKCTVYFKRRSDGQIIHSYKANTQQTQFNTLICWGFYHSEYFKTLRADGISFKYYVGSSTESISAKSTDSLVKLGLENGGIVEIELRFGWKYWKNQMPVFFDSYDEIKDIVNVENLKRSLFTFPAGHCNYLIVNRGIFEILKQGGQIDHRKLFSCVRYSGISQRTTEKLVKRFEEHGFDKNKFFMIELIRWDQTTASECGLFNSEVASVGFEFIIASLDALFAAKQYPGIGCYTLDQFSFKAALQVPNVVRLVYEMILKALLNPKPVF